MLAKTPQPPYYAVIFTSKLSPDDGGYHEMADEMFRQVSSHEGFISLDSVRNAEGIGITTAYFRDAASIIAWKAVPDHLRAQSQGRARWYEAYEVRVARVERAYDFTSGTKG